MALEAELGQESRRAGRAETGATCPFIDWLTRRQWHEARTDQIGFAPDRERPRGLLARAEEDDAGVGRLL